MSVLATLLMSVSPGLIVAAVVVFVLLIWLIGTYNGLVTTRNHCDESWSNVETELKRRHDLIPNLVNTVKGYAAHEQEVLERVIKARNQASDLKGRPELQANVENTLSGQIGRLFLLAEGYPQLKSDQNFLALQQELTTTENRIQRSRRFYNGNVRDLANRIQTFPSNILASLYGFKLREFFEIDDPVERHVPSIDLG